VVNIVFYLHLIYVKLLNNMYHITSCNSINMIVLNTLQPSHMNIYLFYEINSFNAVADSCYFV
jgi:hypothetical protein